MSKDRFVHVMPMVSPKSAWHHMLQNHPQLVCQIPHPTFVNIGFLIAVNALVVKVLSRGVNVVKLVVLKSVLVVMEFHQKKQKVERCVILLKVDIVDLVLFAEICTVDSFN